MWPRSPAGRPETSANTCSIGSGGGVTSSTNPNVGTTSGKDSDSRISGVRPRVFSEALATKPLTSNIPPNLSRPGMTKGCQIQAPQPQGSVEAVNAQLAVVNVWPWDVTADVSTLSAS